MWCDGVVCKLKLMNEIFVFFEKIKKKLRNKKINRVVNHKICVMIFKESLSHEISELIAQATDFSYLTFNMQKRNTNIVKMQK